MKKRLLIITTIFLFILTTRVDALGIATVYGSENIELSYGTRYYEYYFIAQNMEDAPKTVNINVASDQDIAKLRDEKPLYEIPPMTREMRFFIDINLPGNTKSGDKYEVAYIMKTVSGEDGQVVIGQSITKRFTVHVVENTKDNAVKIWFKGITGNFIYNFDKIIGDNVVVKIVLIAIPVGVVILVVVLLLKKKKGKEEVTTIKPEINS